MHSQKGNLAALALLAAAHAASAIPDCSGGVEHNQVIEDRAYTGCFVDGQGTYVATVNTTHPYVFPIIRKCWVELYTVKAAVVYTPWEPIAGDSYCETTSSCSVGITNTSQQCTSVSTAITKDNTQSVQLPFEGFTFTDSGGATQTITHTSDYCSSATTSQQCTWTDDKCHAVCAQREMVAIYGYKRVRCNWHAAQIPQYTRTVCMQDYTMLLPLNSTFAATACNGTCDPNGPCSGFAAPEPPAATPASCWNFRNTIKAVQNAGNANYAVSPGALLAVAALGTWLVL